jgi:antitoxin component of MazEF toxin-antitoxin module
MATDPSPRKITVVGNSPGMTIPAQVLEDLGLESGDRLAVWSEDGQIRAEEAEFRRKE